MGRVVDFVVLAVILFSMLVIQFAGATMLDPLRNEINNTTDLTADEESQIDSMYAAVVKWAPLIAQIGSIVIVAWREYRRQRRTTKGRGL